MIRETSQRFATEKIAALARRIDAEDWFPTELWPLMDGLALGYLGHVIAREVSRASASIGLFYRALRRVICSLRTSCGVR